MASGAEACASMVAGTDIRLAENGSFRPTKACTYLTKRFYRSLFIQTRGVLKKELTAYLRTARQMRQAKGGNTRVDGDRSSIWSPSASGPLRSRIAVPGHWEGDLLTGANNTHIATLVERHTRFTMLVKLPSKDTVTVTAAIARHVRKLPRQLRCSLTWDRGKEMANHKRFTVATQGAGLLLRSTQSLAARQQREHQRLAATVLPQRNRPLALLSGLSQHQCPAAQSTSAKDLGLRNSSR